MHVSCLICGGDVRPIVAVPYLRLLGTCQFVACQRCETVFDIAHLQDEKYIGSNTEYTQSDIKFYVEYAAGIEYFATLIGIFQQLLAYAPKLATRPRFLDIGTAFGFSVALAQHVGWEALGVEPSQFGTVGAELLDVPIISGYLDTAQLPAAAFDCILISDVIEHIGQPSSLLNAALKLLQPHGVLLITTPNSEVITRSLESDMTDVLSPGYHLTIFSPAGLTTILKHTQAHDIRLFFQGGASGRKAIHALVAHAKNLLLEELPWPQIYAQANVLAEAYLTQLVVRKAHAAQYDMLYQGALFRLLERRMQSGDAASAYQLQQQLAQLQNQPSWSEERFHQLSQLDFTAFVQQVPAYTGMFYYYTGMLQLQHIQNYSAAYTAFQVAKRLFWIEKQTQIFPRTGWPERATYYEALALLQANNFAAAQIVFQQLIDEPHDLPQELQEPLRQQMAAINWHLQQSNLTRQSQNASWLTRIHRAINAWFR